MFADQEFSMSWDVEDADETEFSIEDEENLPHLG
jgi:hypothetical protein